MPFSGHIPENIIFIYSHSIKKENDLVVPAFVIDASNQKTIKTAEGWAFANNKYIVKRKERKNIPFSNPIINFLDIRGQGGRAWKTIVDNDFYVDLREEELLWVIKNKGIRPGGILNGKFIFAIVGAQMKLIPIESDIYNKLIDSTNRKKQKNIQMKSFEENHIYENRQGKKFIFLGFVSYYEIKLIRNRDYSKTNDYVIDEIIPKNEKYGLWCDLNSNKQNSPLDVLKQKQTYHFNIKKSMTVCIDHGLVFQANRTSIQEIKKEAINLIKNNISRSFLYSLATIIPYGEKLELDSNFIYKGKLI